MAGFFLALPERACNMANPAKQSAVDGPNGGKLSRAGRPKGTLNKTTVAAKEAIEAAAEGLGGTARLVAWAQEDPANERVFWGSIYPKLLPLTANVTGTMAINWPVPPSRLER
jgi:hypothetical protein